MSAVHFESDSKLHFSVKVDSRNDDEYDDDICMAAHVHQRRPFSRFMFGIIVIASMYGVYVCGSVFHRKVIKLFIHIWNALKMGFVLDKYYLKSDSWAIGTFNLIN